VEVDLGPRSRKAVASVATLAFLAFWIWGAIAVSRLVPDVWWAKGLFFAAAGLGWGLPLLPLFSWAGRGGPGA
jgi:hypothetical protein